MTITANLPDQLDVLRAENAMLEADNLALRGKLAHVHTRLTQALALLDQALDGEALAEFELADAIAFLAGEVTG